MGQRHQAFLIARVRSHGAPPSDPGKRRCVAAFHHQWCYDTLPLAAMHRLIALVSHPENAAVIRAELRAIDGLYGHGSEEPDIPYIPCPYTASLLGSTWTTSLEAGEEIYASGTTLQHALLPAWMGCWDGDNNDGISVLDITEPEHPAYCFLRSQNVLDARGYLSTYYSIGAYEAAAPASTTAESAGNEDEDAADDDSDSGGVKKFQIRRDETAQLRHRLQCIKDLEGVPVISADFLKEAWPDDSFRDPRRSSAASTTEVVESLPLPSLADLTLDLSVKHAVDSEDTAEVERLIWLPGKAEEIKRILRGLSPFPDSGVRLLTCTLSELKETARVDLSDFQLSGPQLVKVLSDCGEVEFLNASFNHALVADDIPLLLEAAPTLRRLVAIGCSSIADAHILGLVQNEPSRFKSLEGLLHPAFLTVEKPDPYPTAFTFVNVTDTGNLSCASIPFFTPAQVVQAVTDVIPWKDRKRNRYVMDASLPLVGFSAFHAGVRKPDGRFSQRPVVSVPFLSPKIPRGQKDFWVFVCRAARFSFHPEVNDGWGFVHYTKVGEESSNAIDPAALQTLRDDPTVIVVTVRGLGCRGKLYDLRGFLECMAREGRPMPSEEAIKELERILYMKNSKSGKFCCPLMAEEDAREIEPLGSNRMSSERYDKWGYRS